MPLQEPTVLTLNKYSLRHIGPRATIFPASPAPNFSVLQATTLVARPLPMSNVPHSPDFVSGSWTGRLLDAGEMALTFPNKEASDGVPWRYRFDPAKRLQWVEIFNDGYLESVCCIDKLETKRDEVIVNGHDGFFLTKNAYERDWTVTQSPRDVIERGTWVWTPAILDTFPSGTNAAGIFTTPYNVWTATTTGVGCSVTVNPSDGGALLTAAQVASSTASIQSANVTVSATGSWRAVANVYASQLTHNTNATHVGFNFLVGEANSDIYFVRFSGGLAKLMWNVGGGGGVSTALVVGQVTLPPGPNYQIMLESDGEWVQGYVNGALISSVRRNTATTTVVNLFAQAYGSTFNAVAVNLKTVILETQQPFLQRGTDKGDYVLPGVASSYPAVGLHARYSNNLDLQGDTQHQQKIHAPIRSQSYTTGTSTAAEYSNQLDTTVNGQSNPAPGAAANWWSCTWFGAVYLRPSLGDYIFTIRGHEASDHTYILYVGKTKWGDAVLSNWPNTTTSAVAINATVAASTLLGTNPDGTTVARDGWYPIKLEWFVNDASGVSNIGNAPHLSFTPPAGYTDPGGTTLVGGVSAIIPATSLSPLGCADQRYQAISHFDLIQQTAQAYNYQFAFVPKQLESGLFPGVIAPRIREGIDYDALLEPDDNARREGLLNYGNTLDATDTCASLWGNGASINTNDSGNQQATIYDPTTVLGSLFDVQGWQDFSDAAFPGLLNALLNSQLGLRLSPWQTITGEPIGRHRQAFAWPLPSAMVPMRWRPGDGMRIRAVDININDTSPRQLLVVTRQIHPNGTTGVQVTFASGPSLRPRSDPAKQVKQAMFQATRWSRALQRQVSTLTGSFIPGQTLAAGGLSNYSVVLINPGDTIARATLRIFWTTVAANVWSIFANSVDVTSTLLGTATFNDSNLPMNIDLTSVASVWAGSAGSGGLYVQLKNTDTVGRLAPDFQIIINVVH